MKKNTHKGHNTADSEVERSGEEPPYLSCLKEGKVDTQTHRQTESERASEGGTGLYFARPLQSCTAAVQWQVLDSLILKGPP